MTLLRRKATGVTRKNCAKGFTHEGVHYKYDSVERMPLTGDKFHFSNKKYSLIIW